MPVNRTARTYPNPTPCARCGHETIGTFAGLCRRCHNLAWNIARNRAAALGKRPSEVFADVVERITTEAGA